MREADAMEPYIEVGRRNAEVKILVKNWCAHAQVVSEGVGMIAVSTGLPIGHHSMACDHATSRGFAAWELSEVALQFHDSNCKGCPHRKAVGLPNISKLIQERDARVEQAGLAELAAAREAAAALTGRTSERAALRVGLNPGTADIVDQLDALDAGRSDDLAHELVMTARLAPDAITPEIVEYLFQLIERGEDWADAPALKILSRGHADRRRLARAALTCLRRSSAVTTAAAAVMRNAVLAEPQMIRGAMVALVHLASEPRGPFDRNRQAQPGPLIQLNRAHPKAVRDAISAWLEQDKPGATGLAARAVEALAPSDPEMAVALTRDLISRLTRSAWLPDPDMSLDRDHEDVARDLREAVAAVFLIDPHAVDALLEKFALGASPAGEVRLTSVYARVLHRGRFRKERPIADGDRLAFRRLLWAVPKSRNEKVLSEIQGTITGQPYDLVGLAAEEIDSLLGAALQMDERIKLFDAAPQQAGAPFLIELERQNSRRMLAGLRDSFIAWASAGAAEVDKPEAYLAVLSALPEDREELAAAMVAAAQPLMTTAQGLNAVLPALYRALVGASVRGRGGAADLIGEMTTRQREDAPDLLMEAFCALLTDPFVLVHASAVSALRSFSPPEAFEPRVREGLAQVIHWHADDKSHEDIVLNCVRLLAHRHLSKAECAGRPGAFLVSLLRKLRPFRLTSDIRAITSKLGRASGLVELLIDLLSDQQIGEHGADKILEAMARLPAEVIYARRAELAALSNLSDFNAWRAALEVIEILSRAGAWQEAKTLADRMMAAIPATKWEARVREFFAQGQLAAAFEAALDEGNVAAAQVLAARWRASPVDPPGEDD